MPEVSKAGFVAKREHSLLSLLELTNELSGTLDLFEIADLGLFNLMGHFGCARSALWLYPEDGRGDAVLMRAHGIADPVARALGAVWTPWLTARLGAVHQPVLLAELGEIASGTGMTLAETSEIALFAPVLSRGRILGFFALGRRVGGEKYGVLDLEVVQASVNLLGSAIENNHLVNRMMESNRVLRQMNEKHEELDRLKSEFLRNLNHELKTPLTIMIAFLDSMLSLEPTDGPRRAHLVQIREQSAKLQGILLNLLDFSRLLKHEFDLRLERTDVQVLLQRYFRDRRPGIASGLREMKLTAGANVPPAICDAERLVRILDALVDNAAKFTPQGSQIHLRLDAVTEREREWVRIQVSDNGPGIPEDRLPVIFDSFRQGDGSVTREHGGIGIGLALAKKLVEEMAGSMSVESTIGKGTTFSVLLPV